MIHELFAAFLRMDKAVSCFRAFHCFHCPLSGGPEARTITQVKSRGPHSECQCTVRTLWSPHSHSSVSLGPTPKLATSRCPLFVVWDRICIHQREMQLHHESLQRGNFVRRSRLLIDLMAMGSTPVAHKVDDFQLRAQNSARV